MNTPQSTQPTEHNSTPAQPAYDARSEKINGIWKIVIAIYGLITLGICIYWIFAESGLCEMVCGWQAEILDGRCYIIVNLAASWIMLLAPLFVVRLIVQKITGAKLDNPLSKE